MRPKIVGKVLKRCAIFGRKRIGGGSSKGFAGSSVRSQCTLENGIAKVTNLLKRLRRSATVLVYLHQKEIEKRPGNFEGIPYIVSCVVVNCFLVPGIEFVRIERVRFT